MLRDGDGLQVALLFQFVGSSFQLGIPRFAKLAYQRFFQELVDRDVFFLSQQHSRAAYAPAVVVQSLVNAVMPHADGV